MDRFDTQEIVKCIEDRVEELNRTWKKYSSRELMESAKDRFLRKFENFIKNHLEEEKEMLKEHQIKVLRQDIDKMWSLCCYTETQKQEFQEYNIPVLSDALMERHRQYLVKLELLYKNHELVFSSMKKYSDLSHHVQDLEKQLKDCTPLLTNRGALLLKYKKDHTDGKKELIRLEQELRRLANQHEDQHGNKLLIHNETISSWLQKFKPDSLKSSASKSRVRPLHCGTSSQTSTIKTPCITASTIGNGQTPAKHSKRCLHGKVDGF